MAKTILITGASSGIGASTAKTIFKPWLECWVNCPKRRQTCNNC